MRYCNNCIIPDTKPGIDIDKSGLCNACRNVNIKNNINWNKKKRDLSKIIQKLKKKIQMDHMIVLFQLAVAGRIVGFKLTL